MEVLNATLAKKMGGENNFCEYQGVDFSYGTYSVLFVVLFFQFVNWIIKSVGPPKSLLDDEWKWRNLTISYLHAFVSVVWTITSLVTQPEMLSDMQHFKTHLVVGLVVFSTGYFLYDFLDLILNGKMFSMWEVQIHHVAVGVMFYYNLVRCEWVGYSVIALLVEVNSFFLHQRKLLQMLGTPYNSRIYRITIFLNLTTFAVFRGIPLLAILWGMWALHPQVAFFYYVCLCCSMFVMVTMNPILFMRLLRSDYLRDRSGKRQKSGHDKTSVNGVNSNNNCLGSVQHSKQS